MNSNGRCPYASDEGLGANQRRRHAAASALVALKYLMKRTLTPSCRAGDIVSLPLEGCGFGLVVVTRVWDTTADGSRLYCYGFGYIFDDPPMAPSLPKLFPDTAVFLATCVDNGLTDLEWMIVGHVDDFKEEDWPIAPEAVSEKLGKAIRPRNPTKRRLALTDPRSPSVRRNVPNDGLVTEAEFNQLPFMSGLMGGQAVETCLTWAIRSRDARYYVAIDEHQVAMWKQINDRAVLRGIFDER